MRSGRPPTSVSLVLRTISAASTSSGVLAVKLSQTAAANCGRPIAVLETKWNIGQCITLYYGPLRYNHQRFFPLVLCFQVFSSFSGEALLRVGREEPKAPTQAQTAWMRACHADFTVGSRGEPLQNDVYTHMLWWILRLQSICFVENLTLHLEIDTLPSRG